ncbi:hypothetical protein [Pseudonocardia sp. ICBG1142]|uniref:hypothetical protein n=1 Tax=Pseudonocardia sp. ICBG1142 TaxID=2846760 RepID=UPI001CF673A2|nr:hypothetical protein [Pseudonocardia sp. ICBG1142]
MPAFDAVVVTSGVNTMDMRPVLREIDASLYKEEVPYLLVGCRVKTQSVPQATTDLAEIASLGYTVARTLIRELTVHSDCVRESRPITQMPGGAHSTARAAEREYRTLAREVFAGLLGMGTEADRKLLAGRRGMKWPDAASESSQKKGKK